jgi:hypothetical protein
MRPICFTVVNKVVTEVRLRKDFYKSRLLLPLSLMRRKIIPKNAMQNVVILKIDLYRDFAASVQQSL